MPCYRPEAAHVLVSSSRVGCSMGAVLLPECCIWVVFLHTFCELLSITLEVEVCGSPVWRHHMIGCTLPRTRLNLHAAITTLCCRMPRIELRLDAECAVHQGSVRILRCFMQLSSGAVSCRLLHVAILFRWSPGG